MQDEYAYLAMEQLEGETLRDFLDRKGNQTLEGKLQFMIEVCKGLAFAHDNGIFHREIRPENIFVLKSGRPKILDFAIAHALSLNSVRDGFEQTSPEYKAPKQLWRQNSDAQWDIFSASMVFFEFLTNTHPFPEMNTTREVEMDSAPLITDIDPMLPLQLGRLIARGLSANPAGRIQSAANFAEELTIAASDQVLLSAELAQEVVGLLGKIQEVRKKLEADPLLNQRSLDEVDLSVLERFTPEITASIASEMDYFSIVELQKECLFTLNRLERFVEDALSSQKESLSEVDLSFEAAAVRTGSTGKGFSIADEKLAQIASLTTSGDVRGILAIVNEVSRLKRKWFAEYSVTETELENLEVAFRKANETVVEISKRQIHAAIVRGNVAEAWEHFLNIEQISSSEPRYLELTSEIREQIQNLAIHRERGETKSHTKNKPLKVDLISKSGRACSSCQHANPMEAVVCESCGFRLAGTRWLTPALEMIQQRTKRVVVQVQDGVVARELSYSRVFVAIGAAVLVLVVAAFLLVPRSQKAAAEIPVVGKAVVTQDALLRTSPGVEDKATPDSKGEGVQNAKNYSSRIAGVNVVRDGIVATPISTPLVPAPVPAKAENVDAAERLLSQGKTDLENAETRIQLNVVIANMDVILNMTFAERRGQAIQADARQIKDKAANSLVLVK
jgi:serine/threonine protein kinase